jgi:hypothetical protein
MGQQIAIAQADEDERAANTWLRSRADLLCLPRSTAEPTPSPRPLGELDCPNQIIFPTTWAEEVLSNWVACLVPASDGSARYLLSPRGPATIEWTRTACLPGGQVVAGRYYLRARGRRADVGEGGQLVQRLMTALSAWIRRTYPRRSVCRPLVFVGPAMAAQLASGDKQLVYRNGTPMPLEHDSKPSAAQDSAGM